MKYLFQNYFLSGVLFLMLQSCSTRSGDDVTETADNTVPIAQNLTSTYSERTLTINYDVHDLEDAHVTVNAFYMAGSGSSLQKLDSVEGDAGPRVRIGAGKKIKITLPAGSVKDLRMGLLVIDEGHTDFQQIINTVDTLQLKSTIKNLYGVRHHLTSPDHLAKVKTMIKDSFEHFGFEVLVQKFRYNEYEGENIVARKQGFGKAPSKLILCAHFDTTSDSPGADDDASGVAALLEVARVLEDIPLEHTIELIAFDLEESGFLGSREYVKANSASMDMLFGAINLDMIGFMSAAKNSQRVPAEIALAFPAIKRQVEQNDGVGDFVVCVANYRSRDFKDEFFETMEKYVPNRKIISILAPGNSEMLPELRIGDHSSFWDQGFSAIFIGDGADSRNPNYHSKNDTLGTIHYGFMKDIVAGTLAFSLEKCKALHGTVQWIHPESMKKNVIDYTPE